MGKIIRFDPDRRKPKRARAWTRPEDYGTPPGTRSRTTPAPRRRSRVWVPLAWLALIAACAGWATRGLWLA